MIYEVRTYTLRPGPWPNSRSALPNGWPCASTRNSGPSGTRGRSAQPGYPRLPLRQPAAPDGRPRCAGPRHRAPAAPGGQDLVVAQESEIADPGAVYAPWAAGTMAPEIFTRCGPIPLPRVTSQRCWMGGVSD